MIGEGLIDEETIDLSNTPTKIGYIFERWEQVKDGQNQAFSDSTPIKEDTYIVAVWVAIIYKINYITNEGLIEGTDTHVDTFVITAFGVDFETSVGVKTPEREGYTFIG